MRRWMRAQKQRLEAAEKASSNEKPELLGQPIAGKMSYHGIADNELDGAPKHEMFVESRCAEVDGSSYNTPATQELP
jgi:hypothetical protein